VTFARPSEQERQQRRAQEREANMRGLCIPVREPRTDVVMGGSTSGIVIAKENASQSGAYMVAAKGLGYCMRCGAQVVPLTGQLDFCHADMGKSQGLKTDVRRGWPGCRACHEEVGRKLPRPVRRAAEILLAVMTRAAVLEAGTWPKRLERWEPRA
jgi:hypothetical protein